MLVRILNESRINIHLDSLFIAVDERIGYMSWKKKHKCLQLGKQPTCPTLEVVLIHEHQNIDIPSRDHHAFFLD